MTSSLQTILVVNNERQSKQNGQTQQAFCLAMNAGSEFAGADKIMHTLFKLNIFLYILIISNKPPLGTCKLSFYSKV